MKIMSFNILCRGQDEHNRENRIPLVVRMIRKNRPDSFGVQEATPEWMAALKCCFPDYTAVGVGRDDGQNKGEYSAVFFRNDKFEALTSGSFWLSETPDVPSKGWDAACVRICSYVLLNEKDTGKHFAHFNTHLDHVGTVAMQKGAELVSSRAAELFPGVPVIITGDFNVTPESAPCKVIKNAGFADCRDKTENTDTGITFHAFLPREQFAGSIIDYIFVNDMVNVTGFSVLRDTVDGELPSDHYPVTALISF